MMRRFFIALLSLFTLVTFAPPLTAHAIAPVETKDRGLYISPLRKYTTLKPGETTTRSFTVANLTNQPMTVTTSIERFSVIDYSYDFKFDTVDNDWIRLVERSVTLKPYESRDLAYRITLPRDAPPGGYYYTLLASSTAAKSTIQAATLLYLTVGGDLSYTSQVTADTLPHIVFASTIPYSFRIKNTGNTHYFALVSARIDGIFYHDAPTGTSQLLMPGTTRSAASSIRSPILPGIYKLTYSITPDHGDKTTGERYFLYAPLWSLAAVALVVGGVLHLLRKRRPRATDKQTMDKS